MWWPAPRNVWRCGRASGSTRRTPGAGDDTMETAMRPTSCTWSRLGGDGVGRAGDVGAQRGLPPSGIARRYSFD